MDSFLKDYGTLIIAIYGVVQIWLIALWKRFILRGNVSIYKTGPIEAGYSSFGPTLALNGTLRSHQKDVFISDISLSVTKTRDNSNINLDWTAFRSPKLQIGQTDPITLEIPSGFNISINQPYRFNIIFSDRKIQAELAPSLNDLFNDWRAYLVNKQDDISKLIHERGVSYDIVVRELFTNEYTKISDKWLRAWDLLNRKIYWEAGDYRISMTVKTSTPDRIFVKEYSFAINDEHFQSLRLNVIAILHELCLGKGNYYFAYVEYI